MAMGRGGAVRLSWLQGLASSDHTTLLLNCYTKLKDVEKLDEFLKASGATEDQPSLHFDVETAIKVGHLGRSFTYTLASPPNFLLQIRWQSRQASSLRGRLADGHAPLMACNLIAGL